MGTDKQASDPQRIYTYVDEEGTVFYTFTKQSMTVLPARRLHLQSRVGEHLINFIAKLRHIGEARARGE
jgi:hypothetical protein